jgi:hypothetical protein
MKIRVLASGEIRHIENGLGSVLLSAGLAELLSKEEPPAPGKLPKYQPKPVTPVWEVVVIGNLHKELAIQMTILGQTYQYTGLPADANRKISWDGGFRWYSGFGREIPSDVLRRYAESWKDNPELRPLGASAEVQQAFSSHENEIQEADRIARGR